MKAAVLDLGTNTFHLLIAEKNGHSIPKILFRERRFVKIGQGGINQGLIAKDAYQRALDAMIAYSQKINEHAVDLVVATATSAIRSASNGQQLLADIKLHAGISPITISGDREAELIFAGVNADVQLGIDNALVMDIGGGSVEFIIGNNSTIHWKQSFEIGAQRLFDLFHNEDPIPTAQIKQLENYLDEKLAPLDQAITKYQPQLLVGSSGTFDTVWDVSQKTDAVRTLGFEEFQSIHKLFIHKSLEDRLQIPGMLAMRAEMIVVASCLLHFVFDKLQHVPLKISQAALKEGVLAKVFAGEEI